MTVVTATAMIAALGAYRARRIALAGPWSSQTNQQVTDFLMSHGFEVVSQVAAEVTRNNDIGRLPPESAIELGLKADRPDADVLFLACGNWWTIPVIEALEAKVGKPVLTTNNRARWQGRKRRGGHGTGPGGGRRRREREKRKRSGCGGIGEEHGACESGETDGLADGAELDHGEPPGCSLVAGAAGSVQSRLKIFKG